MAWQAYCDGRHTAHLAFGSLSVEDGRLGNNFCRPFCCDNRKEARSIARRGPKIRSLEEKCSSRVSQEVNDFLLDFLASSYRTM